MSSATCTSHEESFFVLSPASGAQRRGPWAALRPGACAWSLSAPSTPGSTDAEHAGSTCARRRRAAPGSPSDTFVLGGERGHEAAKPDVRDPRSRNFFVLAEADMDAPPRARLPRRADRSASITTAGLLYSGITVIYSSTSA